MALQALGGSDFSFQLELAGTLEQGSDQLHAETVGAQRAAVDQVFPGLLSGADSEQALGQLIGFGKAQVLEQFAMSLRVFVQPASQAAAVP